MNPNSANSFNGGQVPAYPNAGASSDPNAPVNPFANTGQAPNLGANMNTSMRHQAVPVVGVNVAQAPSATVETKGESGAGRTIALVVACLSAAAAIIAMVAFFVKWQNLQRNGEYDTLLAIEAGKLAQQQEDDAHRRGASLPQACPRNHGTGGPHRKGIRRGEQGRNNMFGR